MNAVIIEDEGLSARRLRNMLAEIDPTITIEQTLDSVEASVKWLSTHEPPAIIFMDIQLSDGLSFDIFRKIDVRCPVIFTTAYDEYAIEAFKVHSVDYLLKPIDKEDLRRSLRKFEDLKQKYSQRDDTLFERLTRSLEEATQRYKTRFLLKSGQSLITVFDKDIAYFLSDRKITIMVARDGKKHIVNESLDELQKQLHPHDFFRLNRQFIARIGAIESVHVHFNGKLKIQLKPPTEHEVLVSKENARAFKKWLDT